MSEISAELRRTVSRAGDRLRAMPPSASAMPRAAGKWSPRQILGHLVDSAANNHRRFVLAQHSEDLVFDGYDQEQWVAAQRYQEADWLALVELWHAYNLHLAHLIQRIPPPILTRPRSRHNLHVLAWRPWPADRPATLEYFVRDYLAHLDHHLRQIFAASTRA